MEGYVTLIRKQDTPYIVNYPYQLPNNGMTRFEWKGTIGKNISKKPVPMDVFEWLRDETSALETGSLIIAKVEEADNSIDDMVKDEINLEKDKNATIESAILTKDELEKLFSTGNHLTLKKKLNELVAGLDEIQTHKVKLYVYQTAMELGIDSNAKRKVICEWYGTNVEDCGWVFNSDENN